MVSPNELRTIKRIEKDVGVVMVSEVIPTRQEVQTRKDGDLLAKISNTEVTASGKDMVKTLLHDIDIVTIAQLLATIVQQEVDVKGKDIIGLGTEEVQALIERAKNFKGGDRNGGGRGRNRSRNRSGGGGSRGGSRGGGNRDRGGRSGDRRGGGGERSGGGNRDSRNGGGNNRGSRNGGGNRDRG